MAREFSRSRGLDAGAKMAARVASVEAKLTALEEALAAFPAQLAQAFEEAFKDK